MRKRILAFMLVCGLAATLGWAQGRGGGGGAGAGQRGGGGRAGQMGAQGKGAMQTTQTRQQTRQQTRLQTQQRTQLQTCNHAAKQLRTQVRSMARTWERSGVNADNARQQMTQLQDQAKSMEQEHARLVESLSDVQKTAAQDRLHDMDQLRDRLQTHLRDMDGELNQSSPSGSKLSQSATAVEQTMKQWEEQYRKMQKEMKG
jgi:chromosome segregation ATPase